MLHPEQEVVTTFCTKITGVSEPRNDFISPSTSSFISS
jgi:hypothetical protein